MVEVTSAPAPIKKKCRRPGCLKQYTEEENDDTKCYFHSGKPIFHDLKKGWECCNVIVYEWPEFEKIRGCCIGRHTDDKEAAGSGGFYKSRTVADASNALEKERIRAMKTADDFNKEAEEKKKAKEEAEKAAGKEKKPVMTRDGKRYICANKGCSAKNFLPEENGPTACNYHTGEPIFHDLKKYWSCCSADKPAYDWDDFMKIPTCAVGEHKMKYK